MKTKQPQSEGVRRIVLTSSIILPVLWLIHVLGRIAESDLRRNELGYVAIVVVVFGIFFCLITRVIPRFAYWIRDGFSLDKRLTLETKQPRSEGIRRMTLACSIVLPASWALWALVAVTEAVLIENHDLRLEEVGFSNLCVLFIIIVIYCIALYLLPKAIAKLVYWIKDGFSLTETDDTA